LFIFFLLIECEFNETNAQSSLTLKEIEMKWNETGLQKLIDQINGNKNGNQN
jgi:hypothetical protein